jgi:hypothetical protein
MCRCYCGWKEGGGDLEPGELEDDIGETRFDGEDWHVEY